MNACWQHVCIKFTFSLCFPNSTTQQSVYKTAKLTHLNKFAFNSFYFLFDISKFSCIFDNIFASNSFFLLCDFQTNAVYNTTVWIKTAKLTHLNNFAFSSFHFLFDFSPKFPKLISTWQFQVQTTSGPAVWPQSELEPLYFTSCCINLLNLGQFSAKHM